VYDIGPVNGLSLLIFKITFLNVLKTLVLSLLALKIR